MENNDDSRMAEEESLDSIPRPTYEALEDYDDNNEEVEEEEHYNTANQLMESEDIPINEEYNEEPKDDEEGGNRYDSDHEKESKQEPSSSSLTNPHNESNMADSRIDDEDFSLEYEEYEPQSGSQSYVEHITADSIKMTDPLIVQGNDGMIKKIKICNTSKDVNDKAEGKIKKSLNNSTTESSSNKVHQPRSSTPMSREYLALQRSVNESKILTEFVTDAANEKPRKLRIKDSGNSSTNFNADHSYTATLRKSTHVSPEKGHPMDETSSSISPSQGRRQHKRFAPLKDSDEDLDSSLRPRSRSKSMHNSELPLTVGGGSHKKLKKWPSEERINKRTNMRSENTEFAQKQMEFLQRVIHACENPVERSRSRSRSDGRSMSCGRKTPSSINENSSCAVYNGAEVAVGGSGVVAQPPKPLKSSSKDRSSKYEMSSENDEQQISQLLGDTTNEYQDDVSVNLSQVSSLAAGSLADATLADNAEVKKHLRSIWHPSPKAGYDSFCWKCHESKVNLCCCKCTRSFHAICVKLNKFDNIWLCPECTAVENILNNPKRSRRNELSLDLLSQLLSFALKRMQYTKGHFNFVMPYEVSTIYKKYIVNPVSLSSLQAKIESKEFRCAEEFVNETKWMLHNASIICNRNNHKIVMATKSIFKICRQEANEIETCPECYLNANTRTDWFVDVCSQPHLLLWAKLKGFPFWPAKAMGGGQNSLVNVRFFGEHDRAFVPLKDCFLYCEQDPNSTTGKRTARELADCIKEVEEHIEKIRTKIGGFNYAPFKTPYEPAEEMRQLSEMMPGVEEFMKKQLGMIIKPSLQFKIYKTADNNLSIVQKASTTPELPTSSLDSEEKERKKKSSSESHDVKKLEETISSPPNYEVVSKVSSEDSNSSKLGTVILKRKSVNGDSKKTSEDESLELPLPKMTKIEDQPVGEDGNKLNAKRKLEIQSTEKPKAKHTKLEPKKIPIITIKTSVVKEANSSANEVTTSKTSQETTKKPDKLQNETNTETSTSGQKVMENLVKHKQGVTIKKITKEPEQNMMNNSKESLLDTSKEKKPDKQKTEEEKARENQKVNSILKGLVPFVEVKQEVVSDNEEEREKQKNEKPQTNETPKQTETTIINHPNTSNKSLDISTATAEINTQEAYKSDSNPTEKVAEKEDNIMPVAQVKEEVVSDEEETNKNVNTDNPKTLIVKVNKCAEKPTSATKPGDIRVVGDTTIQKLPIKNGQAQYYIYSTPNSNNNSNNNTNNSINIGISTKRHSLKGVPYGPLPASAFPKPATKPFQTNDATFQPRAKKSFAQHSPPIEKLKPSTSQSVATQMTLQTSGQHLDQKRTMSKNTMVAIPVDVATNRASTSGANGIIGSIPVPPLTAVSKTVPSTLAHNSTARNSASTIIVSGIAGSLTTPSVMAQAKPSVTTVSTIASITIRNSPTTVTCASLLAPLTTTSTLPATPVATSSILNPLTMTTPPPLAGLSNTTTLINPLQTNGGIEVTNAATQSSSPAATQAPQADTHLLGGLVTPTLASAITDVICRGPPKLAARPGGPLQSEGHPMFPSQAGPVCKRLVDNVHKLTDFFISVVEDTMGEMAQGDDPSLQAKITLLTLELERSKQAYEQEIAELKRTSDLMLCEMRKSMENEKTRVAIEIRKQCEMERLRSVEETKRKQWCANCFREANFYCCWNTSYCDYPCQQLHWSRHSQTCAQTRLGTNETANATTTQTERHHSTKTATLSSSANYNKSTTLGQKKEKGVAKNSANHMMSSSSQLTTNVTPASASRTNTEVLKLPTNTYLRPVNNTNLNSQTMRCNTTYSIPVQRFNAPQLPMTTLANTTNPQTYTIVQQGNSWVMSSTQNNNNNNTGINSSAINSSTIAAPLVNVPQVQSGPSRATGNSMISNKSQKTQIRYH